MLCCLVSSPVTVPLQVPVSSEQISTLHTPHLALVLAAGCWALPLTSLARSHVIHKRLSQEIMLQGWSRPSHSALCAVPREE